MRAGRESRGVEKLRCLLSEQAAEHIENSTEGVGSARQCGRELGFQQGSFRYPHIDKIVEAVIKENLRIEHHDHVDAEKHLEHVLVEVKID